MFSPQGYPNGKVVYDFSLSPVDDQYFSLYDLEPYRQTFAVFALASYKENIRDDDNGIEKSLEDGLKRLRKQYPNAIMHKVLVFGVPGEGLIKVQSKHILPILSSKVSSFTSLETALCDITSDFLAELAVYVISRQMGSFKSPGIKGLDGPRRTASSGGADSAASEKNRTNGSGSVSNGAENKPYNTAIRRGLIRHHSPSFAGHSLHGSGSISITKTGSISLGLTDRSKSKQNGRMIKFLGNMYLLAGRLSDALKEFTEAATILKSTYDHLWYGSALEGIGVCLVLQAFLEVPITIPPIALNATIRNSHGGGIGSISINGAGGGIGGSPGNDSSPALIGGHHGKSTSNNSFSSPGLKALSPTRSSPSPSFDSTSNGNGVSGSLNKLPHSASFTSLTEVPPPGLQDFLPDLTEAILRFYTRTPSSNEETVPQIVYCETILRFTKILVISRHGGGWNGATLSAIVRGTSLPLNITSDSPSSTAIANWCNRIYSTDISNLPIELQVRVYTGLASVYAGVGLIRKRAFVLREMIMHIMMMIKQREVGNEDSSGDNGKVIIPLGSGAHIFTSLDRSQKGGIVEFLDSICQVFAAGNVTSIGCGWLDLKMSFLKSCISVCESISHYHGVVYFVGLMLSTMADALTKDEQLKMFNSLHRAIELSQKSEKGSVLAHYWDPYLLRDIKLLPSTTIMPTRYSKPSSSEIVSSDGGDNVFLYNPYAKSRIDDSSERILIQGEKAEFLLKIQNPFEFEIHVNEITLLTKNVDLDAKISNVVIPASAVHDLIITAVPKISGELVIIGCKVQIADCQPEEYLLSNNGFPRLNIKLKTHGLKSGTIQPEQGWGAPSQSRQLKFEVIPSQPVLSLKTLSLDQAWLMLLEGEKQDFVVRLTNLSDTAARLVHFSFIDSTTEPLQTALTDKELSLSEAYECEYFLYKRPALRLLNSPDIAAHETSKYDFKISGKRALTNAVINLDYGSVIKTVTEDSSSSSTWIRRVSVPINVTVNSSIELAGCDIIPLPKYSNSDDHALTRIPGLLQPLEKDDQYFIFVVDLRNAWSQPLEVNLWSLSEGNNGKEDSNPPTRLSEITQVIYPSRTNRFLLPIRWSKVVGDGEVAVYNRPIPSLSKRQYVVDSNITADQLRFMTETFWYRENLLKLVGGEWKVNNSSRHGTVELRGIRLSRWMVNALRTESISVTMNMASSAEEEEESEAPAVKQLNELSWQALVENENCVIRSTIHNGTNVPIGGILRLVPSMRYISSGSTDADDIHGKIIYNGLLQRPILNIPPGQSVEVDLGIVILSRGEYEWTSIFEVSRGPEILRQYVQREPLYINVI